MPQHFNNSQFVHANNDQHPTAKEQYRNNNNYSSQTEPFHINMDPEQRNRMIYDSIQKEKCGRCKALGIFVCEHKTPVRDKFRGMLESEGKMYESPRDYMDLEDATIYTAPRGNSELGYMQNASSFHRLAIRQQQKLHDGKSKSVSLNQINLNGYNNGYTNNNESRESYRNTNQNGTQKNSNGVNRNGYTNGSINSYQNGSIKSQNNNNGNVRASVQIKQRTPVKHNNNNNNGSTPQNQTQMSDTERNEYETDSHQPTVYNIESKHSNPKKAESGCCTIL